MQPPPRTKHAKQRPPPQNEWFRLAPPLGGVITGASRRPPSAPATQACCSSSVAVGRWEGSTWGGYDVAGKGRAGWLEGDGFVLLGLGWKLKPPLSYRPSPCLPEHTQAPVSAYSSTFQAPNTPHTHASVHTRPPPKHTHTHTHTPASTDPKSRPPSG